MCVQTDNMVVFMLACCGLCVCRQTIWWYSYWHVVAYVCADRQYGGIHTGMLWLMCVQTDNMVVFILACCGLCVCRQTVWWYSYWHVVAYVCADRQYGSIHAGMLWLMCVQTDSMVVFMLACCGLCVCRQTVWWYSCWHVVAYVCADRQYGGIHAGMLWLMCVQTDTMVVFMLACCGLCVCRQTIWWYSYWHVVAYVCADRQYGGIHTGMLWLMCVQTDNMVIFMLACCGLCVCRQTIWWYSYWHVVAYVCADRQYGGIHTGMLWLMCGQTDNMVVFILACCGLCVCRQTIWWYSYWHVVAYVCADRQYGGIHTGMLWLMCVQTDNMVVFILACCGLCVCRQTIWWYSYWHVVAYVCADRQYGGIHTGMVWLMCVQTDNMVVFILACCGLCVCRQTIWWYSCWHVVAYVCADIDNMLLQMVNSKNNLFSFSLLSFQASH